MKRHQNYRNTSRLIIAFLPNLAELAKTTHNHVGLESPYTLRILRKSVESTLPKFSSGTTGFYLKTKTCRTSLERRQQLIVDKVIQRH